VGEDLTMNDIMHVAARYEGGAIGLPGRAVTISNSERSRLPCGLQWWFGYGEGLTPDAAARPLRYGRAWHWFLEDLHLWWLHHDSVYPAGAAQNCVWCDGGTTGSGKACPECDGSLRGPAARAHHEWRELEDAGQIEPGQAHADWTRLTRAIEGYLYVYGRAPLTSYKPIGVELSLACPILNPATGKPYAPRTWVVKDAKGLRMARTGEAHETGARLVQWPMYQLLTIDKLLVERDDPSRLWLWEGKSAADPSGRCRTLSLDPQIHGYAWALKHAAAAGQLQHLGVPRDARVAGWIFDVASSAMQRDPDLLKAAKLQDRNELGELLYIGKRGVIQTEETRKKSWMVGDDGEPLLVSTGLSRRRDRTIPSWRYLEAIRSHGFDEEEYEDHIGYLAEEKDPGLYERTWGTCGDEITDRYAVEIFGVARQVAAMRRASAQAKDAWDIARDFPRTPVCTMPGGSCAFTGPCVQDGDLVRRGFKKSSPTRWVPAIPLDDEQQEILEW
jgi:hypothetical protein